MEQEDWDQLLGPLFGAAGLAGPDRLTPHFRPHNPLDLAETVPVETLKKARLYLDCGDDDFLIAGNCALHLALHSTARSRTNSGSGTARIPGPTGAPGSSTAWSSSAGASTDERLFPRQAPRRRPAHRNASQPALAQLAEIASAAGFDWLFLDTEHGALGPGDVLRLSRPRASRAPAWCASRN